jgi:hypothetical protein
MLRLLALISVLISFSALKVQAQNLKDDSVKNIAIADAKKFRLDKADLKIFKHNRHNSNSDYFKPAKANVTDTTLLRDSVYVKAYRQKAWKRTRNRRTLWHYAWVTEAVYGGAYIVLLVGVLLSNPENVR